MCCPYEVTRVTCKVIYYHTHFFFTLKKLILYQGNGHEADFDKDEQVFIMDVYNAYIYPRDMKVKSESVKSRQVPPTKNNKWLLYFKVSSRVKNHNFLKFAIFKWLNRANQELSFKKNSRKKCFFCADLWRAKVFSMLIILIDRWQVLSYLIRM